MGTSGIVARYFFLYVLSSLPVVFAGRRGRRWPLDTPTLALVPLVMSALPGRGGVEGGWKERREKGREWRVGVKGGREGGRKEGREWRVGVKGGRGGREDSEGGREG